MENFKRVTIILCFAILFFSRTKPSTLIPCNGGIHISIHEQVIQLALARINLQLKEIIRKIIHIRLTPGAGGGNYNVPEPDPITDAEFWDQIHEQELGESEGEESSQPTYQLSKEIMKENDSTPDRPPLEFTDWEGNTRVIKNKELKKTLFGHGSEAGVSNSLVECPIQPDPNKFQRTTCCEITNEGLDNLEKKIMDMTQSRVKCLIMKVRTLIWKQANV